MSKVVNTAAEAVADIASGSRLAVGGFGLCGIPDALIAAIADGDATDLEVFSNNCGVDDYGLGILLGAHRIARGDGVVHGGEQGVRAPVSRR